MNLRRTTVAQRKRALDLANMWHWYWLWPQKGDAKIYDNQMYINNCLKWMLLGDLIHDFNDVPKEHLYAWIEENYN